MEAEKLLPTGKLLDLAGRAGFEPGNPGRWKASSTTTFTMA